MRVCHKQSRGSGVERNGARLQDIRHIKERGAIHLLRKKYMYANVYVHIIIIIIAYHYLSLLHNYILYGAGTDEIALNRRHPVTALP